MNHPGSARNFGCGGLPVELLRVEENRHLTPNLRFLARALFGDNAYLTNTAPRCSDWITGKHKVGDGLLWEPWKHRLWLVEVEWKIGNFFDQVRAFAKSKIDEAKLRRELGGVLDEFASALESLPHLKDGAVTQAIIDKTINNHVSNGHFQPHAWVILGHDGNREELKEGYEAELKAYFSGNMGYILSMARLFLSDCSNVILLEQSHSDNLRQQITIPDSLLIPVGLSPLSEETPLTPHVGNRSNNLPTNRENSPQPKGKGKKMWEALRGVMKQRGRELGEDDCAKVQLRISISGMTKVFPVDWGSWTEIKVFDDSGESMRVAVAARRFFSKEDFDHVARDYGEFVFEGGEELADYQTVERAQKGGR